MGYARKKLTLFLATHPWCCFCGGQISAETIDHVPNRACFHGKSGPEGFEFPACRRCQNLLRQEEQFFAFMCHLSDHDPKNYDQKSSRNLIKGIRNNLPDLFPEIITRANEQRRGLKHLGLSKPQGMLLSDLPMIRLPLSVDPAIRKVAAKLGLALYYRHKSVPAPSTHFIAAYWAQVADKNSMVRFRDILKDLPNFQQGLRRNLEFGNRFTYAWNIQDVDEPDIFMCIAKFGSGLVVCNMVVDQTIPLDNEMAGKWISVHDFSSGNFAEWENLEFGWVGSNFQEPQ